MQTLCFEHAYTPSGWAQSVSVQIDAQGTIQTLRCGDKSGEWVPGRCVPSMPNLHSHAHQRAIAGLSEYARSGEDNFWSWRDAMYQTALTLEPEQLEAIAAQLYVELLEAGYTWVAEFQYLHHDPTGQPYNNLAEMCLRTWAAAQQTGIGTTLLPVLYRDGGFGAQPSQRDQRRFVNDWSRYQRLCEALDQALSGDPHARWGMAPHSLRAVDAALLEQLVDYGHSSACTGPIHIHIAEQQKEIDDCLAHYGARPVEWLLGEHEIDARWCLVHATHMTRAEAEHMARSGAIAGLCPSTEGNLGDGFFPFEHYRGAWGIGSDSHISRHLSEELRWLEYGQRLRQQVRNSIRHPDTAHTGEGLLRAAWAGGAQACGAPLGAIAPGHRADFVTLAHDHPSLYGHSDQSLLDAWIFASPDRAIDRVYSGGVLRVEGGRHHQGEEIFQRFRATIDQLRNSQ